jgi:hypothetical protein
MGAFEQHIYLDARLGRADLWRIDAEHGGPTLTGGFDIAADDGHLSHYLHSGVAARRALGDAHAGDEGEKERQGFHTLVFRWRRGREQGGLDLRQRRKRAARAFQ